jgi:hypothetical protein
VAGLTFMYTYHVATGMFASRVTSATGTRNSTRTGSDLRAGNGDGGGRVTLVSPTKVTTTLTAPLAVWTTLVLDVVPEPTAPLMLLTGAAVLVVLGRRRRA